MLSVAAAMPAFNAKDVDVDAAALLGNNDALPFEEDDDNAMMGGGMTSTEHSREITADFVGDDELVEHDAPVQTKRFSLLTSMTSTTTVQQKSVTEDEVVNDVDDDSDYQPDEADDDDDEMDDEAGDDDESEDDEAHLQSLEAQLDEHADEVGDYYLQRMLAKRATLDGDEAAWVDSYIARQRQWKETHGTSIDEMDLDLLRPARRASSAKKANKTKKSATTLAIATEAIAEAWNGRVAQYLPPTLRQQPAEFLLSLVAVVLFVGIALAVQFYVAFQAPPVTL